MWLESKRPPLTGRVKMGFLWEATREGSLSETWRQLALSIGASTSLRGGVGRPSMLEMGDSSLRKLAFGTTPKLIVSLEEV